MTTFSWSPTCTSSLKSWGGVPDYADSELPLLGPLADVNSSFKLDFVAGQCINKHNKLVPYKTSGVRVDEIKAECTRRGLRVASTRTDCEKILERSDKRDWDMCVEDFVLTDLDKKMPALIDTEEDKFSTWSWKKTVAILARGGDGGHRIHGLPEEERGGQARPLRRHTAAERDGSAGSLRGQHQ